MGLKIGSLNSPVVTYYPLPIVGRRPISHRFTQCSDLSRTNARTDTRIGLAKGGNFIGCQTVELCTEIDHWFIQQRIATVQRSVKNGQRSDFVSQNFLYFPFNTNISTAAAVAGDSGDSGVVAGDASRFILVAAAAAVCSLSQRLCVSSHGVAHWRQELDATISSVVVHVSRYLYTP